MTFDLQSGQEMERSWFVVQSWFDDVVQCHSRVSVHTSVRSM